MEQKLQTRTKPLVGLRVPEDALEALRRIADRDLSTVQQVIRRAIAQYIEREEAA